MQVELCTPRPCREGGREGGKEGRREGGREGRDRFTKGR